MHSKVILLAAGICDGTMQMWREAQHRCNRIHMPLIGGADYDDHGVARRLDTDEAYLLINGFARNFRLRPDTRYYHLYLDFQTTPPLAGYGVQTLNVGEDAVTRALLDAVAASVRETDPVRCRILREHTEAFAEIGRILDVLMRRLQRHYAIRTVENPKIQHAVRYIEEHYAERLSNEEIAARLHIDSKYLIRLFRRYMDMPPYQYVTQCRIEHALAELRSGKSVADTAYTCGYQSENAFRIAFKRIMGCAPVTMIKKY